MLDFVICGRLKGSVDFFDVACTEDSHELVLLDDLNGNCLVDIGDVAFEQPLPMDNTSIDRFMEQAPKDNCVGLVCGFDCIIFFYADGTLDVYNTSITKKLRSATYDTDTEYVGNVEF